MTNKQPEALALADALHEAFTGSTKGTWKKGATTHHTVTDGWYKIAEFHHAADAQFCDIAHALAEPIAAELRRLQQSEREGWRYANELERECHRLQEQVAGAMREALAQPDVSLIDEGKTAQPLSYNEWANHEYTTVLLEAVKDLSEKLAKYTQHSAKPAQRKPLTDEEIKSIYTQETGSLISDSPWALLDFARAIEAAHGITSD